MSNLILVIDDSKTICEVIQITLQREGYEVVYCLSGEAALHWLASSEARVPALIFVDLCLPGIDGYSVIQRLHATPIFKPVPIVIV